MTSFIFNKGTYSRETTRFGLRMCTNECLEVLKYYASSKSIDPFVLSPSLGLFPWTSSGRIKNERGGKYPQCHSGQDHDKNSAQTRLPVKRLLEGHAVESWWLIFEHYMVRPRPIFAFLWWVVLPADVEIYSRNALRLDSHLRIKKWLSEVPEGLVWKSLWIAPPVRSDIRRQRATFRRHNVKK